MIKKLLWLAFYSLPLIAYAADFTDPRGPQPRIQVALSQKSDRFSTSPTVKLIINKPHPAQPGPLDGVPGGADASLFRKSNALQVKAYVQKRAVEFGVNPFLAVWIVKHESSFNPRARGDGDASRGLWQISKVYHPEVSDDEAFSVTSSTDWSLHQIRAGKVNEWSAYRNCRTLYADCPF